jgi:lysylphosphatidylglycerol synthetase-like protein (DUF2156 family)
MEARKEERHFMDKMQSPQRLHKEQYVKLIRIALSIAVAVMGVINGLTVLLPTRPGRLALLFNLFDQLAPFAPSIWSFIRTGRTIALIAGFFLLLIAFGLARGKRRAWQIAIVLLPLSALAHLAKGLDVEEAMLAGTLWIGLLVGQAFFRVESDPARIRQGIALLLLGFILLFIYGLSGFYLLQEQFLSSGTFAGFLRSFLLRIVNLPAQEITPLTSHAGWFLQSIPWLSAIALLTGMFMLLRPISARWWATYQKDRLAHIRQKADELIYRYGNQTLSFFALAPENLRYLASNGEGLVSYRLTNNVAVVLGDPVCAPQAFERVTRNFIDFCTLQDWRVAIYQAHPEYLPAYRALGLHAFKIGEEALLNPQTFTLSGSAMANVRTSCRRAERDGVTVHWYEGTPPEELLKQLQELSHDWLVRKGGKHAKEMGFSMGRLDELAEAAARAGALAEMPLLSEDNLPIIAPRLVTGVALDASGRTYAFVTFTPIYGCQAPSSANSDSPTKVGGWGWALDLMRRASDAPPGVIELLIVRAIERFRDRGVEVVSLGMIAMADTKQEMTPRQREFASFVTDHLRLLETHRSLLHFKQKFHPCWESRYIVFSTTLVLPRIALALLRVHQS